MSDYVKLSRKIFEWEWYRHNNVKCFFIHCILKANWKEGRFEGVDVPRGSFVSSLPRLSEETGLTIAQVRGCIEKLVSTGEIAVKPTNKYSVFSILRYDAYQYESQTNSSQATNKSHSNNIQIATIEEGNKGRKERREEVGQRPTLSEIKSYLSEVGSKLNAEKFFNYYESNGWRVGKNPMKNWKAAVATWEAKDGLKRDKKPEQKEEKTEEQQTLNLWDGE